eukprot:11925372-Ditylum_brightwellii.AAC.1
MSDQDRSKVIEEHDDPPPALVKPVPRLSHASQTPDQTGSIGLLDGLMLKHGVWGKGINGTSSHYKEFKNLVEMVEEEALGGDLKGI